MNRINFLPPWVETTLQPAFYDAESGTVLQQVARMYGKVNQLIRNVNDQNDAIELYIAKFIELKDYVEDYFDNLDVQEEINNKLDEMAGDGTLQEIIGAYLQANVTWTFDNVAEMKDATNLISGSYVQTLGYHSIDDGGGAIYYINTTGTADDASVIAIGDTLKAHIVLTDEIIAEQFGAYGDDDHNDATAIQKALDYGASVNLPVKLLINKVYKINSTLTALNDFIMDGQLHYTGTSTGINIGDPDSRTVNKIFKVNIKSDNAVGTTNSTGAKIYNLYECDLTLYHIENFYIGVQLIGINSNGFVYNKVKIVKIANYFTGLELLNDVSGWVNENQFYGGRIVNLSTHTYTGAGTAIKLNSNASYMNNCNVFYAPCVEGNLVGIDIEWGRMNKVYDVRCENVTTSVKFGNDSLQNFIKLGYGTPTTQGMTRPNMVLASEEFNDSFYTKQIFDSGYISSNTVECSNGLRIAKLYAMVNDSMSVKIRGSVSGGKIVSGSDSCTGCMINLDSSDKTIYLKQVVSDGNRICVVSYDGNGAVIDEAPVSAGGATFYSYTSSALNSTVYRTGNNATKDVLIQLPATAVKCFIGTISPSGITMENLQFYVKENSKSFVSYPQANIVYPLSDRTPTTAGYNGQVCMSSESTENGWRYNGSAWVSF